MDYRVEILRDMAESLATLADETIDSPSTKTDALRSMSESLDELAKGGGGGGAGVVVIETVEDGEDILLSKTWDEIKAYAEAKTPIFVWTDAEAMGQYDNIAFLLVTNVYHYDNTEYLVDVYGYTGSLYGAIQFSAYHSDDNPVMVRYQ